MFSICLAGENDDSQVHEIALRNKKLKLFFVYFNDHSFALFLNSCQCAIFPIVRSNIVDIKKIPLK